MPPPTPYINKYVRQYWTTILKVIVCVVLATSWAQTINANDKEDPPPDTSPDLQWRISANLIPYTATIINISGEYLITPKMSIQLPVYWCPWNISEKHALRTFAIQPTFKYWICNTSRSHFVGVHANVAWYNLYNGRDRYQDNGTPLYGAGISYGYLLKINERFGIEFSIGIGYNSMKYNRYYNIKNGAYIDTRTTQYFGIDQAGISMTYDF